MRMPWFVPLLVLLAVASPALGQFTPREDAIWARATSSPITLDGVLDELAWSQAESVIVDYGQDAGIPGSGWKQEAGLLIMNDQTHAVLKFLVDGNNQLYLGARISDQSVGGSMNFNRFDGLLMALKNHLFEGYPKGPAEYMYAWWYEGSIDPQPVGQLPAFIGMWADRPPGTPRTPEQIAAWDAMTVVHGTSNDDSGDPDQGYTVEMRFDLGVVGYDVTSPQGDIVEWNISIYDCDWYWPFDGYRFYSNRVWYQSPWGNDDWYSEVRIHARPDVTTASGPAPAIEPEMYIANLTPAPTVDGLLDEAIWNDPRVKTFDIRWDDNALRQTYPAVGPYRAGQFEGYNEGAQVFDPGDATVKIMQSGDDLYFGFDVRDEVVQYYADFSRWDGFLVSINEIATRGPDNNLLGRRISFQVGQDGSALAQDYLQTLIGMGKAAVALHLKPGTTVDTLGVDVDQGYTAELRIDLTGMGYTAGHVDGPLFLGINLLDGDSYIPFTDSYGTRTWWFREYENECCPIWAQLTDRMVAVGETPWSSPSYGWATGYPNPSVRPAIRYRLPERNRVTLEIYDLRGRLVERQVLGVRGEGEYSAPVFPARDDAAGVYMYRLRLEDPASGKVRSTLSGKLTVLK